MDNLVIRIQEYYFRFVIFQASYKVIIDRDQYHFIENELVTPYPAGDFAQGPVVYFRPVINIDANIDFAFIFEHLKHCACFRFHTEAFF